MMRRLVFILVLLLAYKVVNGQSLDWFFGMGSESTLFTKGVVCFDNDDNIILAGNYAGEMNFNPQGSPYILTNSVDEPRCFIAKYNSAGLMIWVKELGYGAINSVVFENNTIIVSGGISLDSDLDPSSNEVLIYQQTVGEYDYSGFFGIYDNEGNYLSHYFLDCMVHAYFSKVLTFENGDYLAVGLKSLGGVDLSGNGLYEGMNSAGLFLLRVSAMGEISWSQVYEGSGFRSLTLDSQDQIGLLLSGCNDADPGEGVINLTSENVLVFLNPLNGNLLWYGSTEVAGNGICKHIVDANDVVRLVVRSLGNLDIDLTENIQTVSSDVTNFYTFERRINNQGELLNYVVRPNGARDFFVDNLGNYYQIGEVNVANFDFDPSDNTYSLGDGGTFDYLVKYGTENEFLFASLGTSNLQFIQVSEVGTILCMDYFGWGPAYPPAGQTANESPFNDPSMYYYLLARYNQSICDYTNVTLQEISLSTCEESGVIEAQVSGGGNDYMLTWSGGVPQEDNSILYDAMGVYEVIVTTANGCQDSAAIFALGAITTSVDFMPLVEAEEFRTGFENHTQIIAANLGCEMASGYIELVIDTSLVYISATPIPTSIIGDTLRWDFDSSGWGWENFFFSDLTFLVPTWMMPGDSIRCDVHVFSEAESENLGNNISEYVFPIVNGYDPNDKQVWPIGIGEEGFVPITTESLIYTIRFQNTGNAEAINVRVEDVINEHLDISTLEVLYSSHQMHVEWDEFNTLNFIFDNINLPDSASAPMESIGTFVYRISLEPDLASGTEISNTASIFFDFNPPIVTNTVYTTLNEDIVSISENDQVNLVTQDWNVLYSNKQQGLMISTEGGQGNKKSICFFDLLGKQLFRTTFTDASYFLKTDHLNSGIYLVQFSMDDHVYVEKVFIP